MTLDEWEVNQILDSRFDQHCKGSGLLYLVKWKGFDHTPDTTSWEPPEHLVNASDLVKTFHLTYLGKPSPKLFKEVYFSLTYHTLVDFGQFLDTFYVFFFTDVWKYLQVLFLQLQYLHHLLHHIPTSILSRSVPHAKSHPIVYTLMSLDDLTDHSQDSPTQSALI